MSEHSLHNKMNMKTIATIFSDILFRPSEYQSNDMIMWRMFTDLLCLMIRENHRIFRVSENNKNDICGLSVATGDRESVITAKTI